jgi:hypothetical protein
MRERWLAMGAWVAFVLVVGVVAYLAVSACDLGLHPLFGLSYCPQTSADPLAAERERERDLLDRLHQAQLNVARLPICLPDPPRRQPDRRADNSVPTPTPTPTPTPNEPLVIPHNLNDLNGCWQSVSGDINMVSDDAQHTPIGKVRICYCLSGNGGGETRYIYQDGARCTGPLRAELSQERLTIKHGRISCSGNKGFVVPTDITCTAKEGEDSATCDSYVHLKRPTTTTNQKYHRVSPEYCN